MERTEIIRILKEEDYPDFLLDKTADKIDAFSSVIAIEFKEWIVSRNNPVLEIEGISYSDLVAKWGMKPIGAFITLDWLLREPALAKDALRKGIK